MNRVYVCTNLDRQVLGIFLALSDAQASWRLSQHNLGETRFVEQTNGNKDTAVYVGDKQTGWIEGHPILTGTHHL